jgi:hypothetical protein
LPHVKFEGPLNIEEAWSDPPGFSLSVPEQDLHVKFLEAYLERARRAVLYRYMVSEGRLTQSVQILLARDGEGWILKLDRAYPILRTAGVKLLLATLAGWLEERGARISATNLEAFLHRGRFYAQHA